MAEKKSQLSRTLALKDWGEFFQAKRKLNKDTEAGNQVYIVYNDGPLREEHAFQFCFILLLQKETPLANAAFWAARRGNLTLLRLLLNSGRVDVDCRDSHGTTLLMVASYAGHIDCVKELVLQGADINLQRESGTTALFFAAQQGHNNVVRFLFEFGASTEFRTKDGGTALLAASQYGHMQVVETLLKHGANIHDQLYDGATALFLAAQGGYLDVIRLLLSSGAKVNQPRQVMFVRAHACGAVGRVACSLQQHLPKIASQIWVSLKPFCLWMKVHP
nr:ankyrin repeat domain-containing protein 29-like [Odocoileus virginianus texanus]